MDGIPIGICDGRVLGYLEGFIDRAVVGKCLFLCLCIGYVHIQEWEFWQCYSVFMLVSL